MNREEETSWWATVLALIFIYMAWGLLTLDRHVMLDHKWGDYLSVLSDHYVLTEEETKNMTRADNNCG